MKLNVEGAEFPILLNTPGPVLRRFDTIVALYHCDLCPGHTAPELLRHLEGSGFACAVRHQTEKRGWIIATRKGAGAP